MNKNIFNLHFSIKSASQINVLGTSLVVQWLRLHVPNAGDLDLIPAQGLKILRTANKTWCSQINKYISNKCIV